MFSKCAHCGGLAYPTRNLRICSAFRGQLPPVPRKGKPGGIFKLSKSQSPARRAFRLSAPSSRRITLHRLGLLTLFGRRSGGGFPLTVRAIAFILIISCHFFLSVVLQSMMQRSVLASRSRGLNRLSRKFVTT